MSVLSRRHVALSQVTGFERQNSGGEAMAIRGNRAGPEAPDPLDRQAAVTSGGTCPLCGNANACARSVQDGSVTTCWCEGVLINSAVVEQLPGGTRGVVCICHACATSANASEE